MTLFEVLIENKWVECELVKIEDTAIIKVGQSIINNVDLASIRQVYETCIDHIDFGKDKCNIQCPFCRSI